MEKRILVISWFFPPINSSEGLVTYKLLKNSKYKYDVITQKSNESWSYGQTNDLDYGENINCINIETTNMDVFKTEAIKYFEKNKNKYDIVMTRSMAEVAHVIGLKIKEIKNSIIWIASFGDPIGNNPFTLKSINSENPFSIKQRYVRPMGIREILSPKRMLKSYLYNKGNKDNYNLFIKESNILQEKILNSCDFVIYNSIYQSEYMLKDYANKNELGKKTIILPHSFDEDLYKKEKKIKKEKINFSFLGLLDDIRTPHCLFEAINKLKEYDENLCDKVEFNFYGNLSDKEKLYLMNNYLLDIVKVQQPVNYLKSLEIMQNSDWLIHIDANIQEIIEKNIFFAAKIADYIGSKSNIIGITMIDGISADILREYNALCLENCVEEIFNYLFLIIYENFETKLNPNYRKLYDAKEVASTFDKLIESIE